VKVTSFAKIVRLY